MDDKKDILVFECNDIGPSGDLRRLKIRVYEDSGGKKIEVRNLLHHNPEENLQVLRPVYGYELKMAEEIARLQAELNNQKKCDVVTDEEPECVKTKRDDRVRSYYWDTNINPCRAIIGTDTDDCVYFSHYLSDELWQSENDKLKYYHYTISGVDNVYLKNIVNVEKDVTSDNPGDTLTSIDNIEGLHTIISLHIIDHLDTLSARELRFLRTEMGLSEEQLSTILNVPNNAINVVEQSGHGAFYDKATKVFYSLVATHFCVTLDPELSDTCIISPTSKYTLYIEKLTQVSE